MKTEKFAVELEFTEDVLGSVPKSKEVYAQYIKTKAPEGQGGDEVATVQESEEKGWTGFHADGGGLFVYDYTIRGFFKEAAAATKSQSDIKAFKSKIDRLVFISRRRLHFLRAGKPIQEPDGVFERPLKAMTMQGPRVTLARSDKLEAAKGVSLKFEVIILDNRDGVTRKWLEGLFEYGRFQGLGQFRNGSYGRFEVKVK